MFDGSASSLSLNDTHTQMLGLTVQNDLFCILLRFRQHKHVISADIEKMYHQILLRAEDRKFQRILWRSNQNAPVSTYELNTVTYTVPRLHHF